MSPESAKDNTTPGAPGEREPGAMEPAAGEDPHGAPRLCSRCHLVHTQCSAHNRQGLPCQKYPMHGQLVCANHGGKTPGAMAAAQERLRLREATASSRTFGLPRNVDPHEALLEELRRTAGVVTWLDQLVGGLRPDEVVWGTTREKTGGDDRGTTREATTSVWVKLWQEERRHYLAVGAACHKAGIHDQQIQLAQDQGRMLGGAVQRILTALYERLSEALGEYEAAQAVMAAVWEEGVHTIVPHELRAVAAHAEPEEGGSGEG